MSLIDAQLLFSRLLGKLLGYADQAGIAVTMGECFRTPVQAAWNAQHGLGSAHSLHMDRLAVDLLAFRREAGQWAWLSSGTEPEYRLLGGFWTRLHPDCRWGGDFTTKPDPGHFSITFGGHA